MGELIINSKVYGTQTILFDDSDSDLVLSRAWSLRKSSDTFYAVSWVNKNSPAIKMHRLIMGVTDRKDIIDHVNGNGIDNRKQNLRKATVTQNNANRKCASSTGYLGVSACKWKGRIIGYNSDISHGGKRYYCGYHKDPISAAKAYDLKAKELHKEFARLNFK